MLLLSLAGAAHGCGQKGPLALPGATKAGAPAAPASASSAAAPP